MSALHRLLYTGPLRTWLRGSGLTRVLRSPAALRGYLRRRRFAAQRPADISVRVAGLDIRGQTRSVQEYLRTLSLVDDAHLVAALARACRPGDTAWDIGANIGLYSIVLAQLTGSDGRVVAFEPEPRAQRQLLDNLALNQQQGVRVEAIALSSAAGRARLFTAAHGVDGTHSLVANACGGEAVEVELASGDAFRTQHHLAVPAILKIDVEGAELDVLRGLEQTLAQPDCRAVLCEIHFALLARAGRADHPARICDLLTRHGFARQTWLDASHLFAEKIRPAC